MSNNTLNTLKTICLINNCKILQSSNYKNVLFENTQFPLPIADNNTYEILYYLVFYLQTILDFKLNTSPHIQQKLINPSSFNTVRILSKNNINIQISLNYLYNNTLTFSINNHKFNTLDKFITFILEKL